MSIEAMKQALEALETATHQWEKEDAITSLRQAIEQAEKQEPVAYVTGTYAGRFVVNPVNPAMVLPVNMALYTTPQPQHKWVDVECPLCGEMAVAYTHPNLNKEKNT